MLSIQDITTIILNHDSSANDVSKDYRVKDEDIPSKYDIESLFPTKPIKTLTGYALFTLWFMKKHNDLPIRELWHKQNKEAWDKLSNEINAVYFPPKKRGAMRFIPANTDIEFSFSN